MAFSCRKDEKRERERELTRKERTDTRNAALGSVTPRQQPSLFGRHSLNRNTQIVFHDFRSSLDTKPPLRFSFQFLPPSMDQVSRNHSSSLSIARFLASQLLNPCPSPSNRIMSHRPASGLDRIRSSIWVACCSGTILSSVPCKSNNGAVICAALWSGERSIIGKREFRKKHRSDRHREREKERTYESNSRVLGREFLRASCTGTGIQTFKQKQKNVGAFSFLSS